MRQVRQFHSATSELIFRHAWTLVFFGAIGILLWCCTKSELVGSDLLDEEASSIVFTDTISIQCSHERDSIIKTFSPDDIGRLVTRSMIGNLDDPYFGKSSSVMNAEMFLFNASSAFLGNTVDSVVLSLRYDTLGLYGDLSQQVSVGVFRIEEDLNSETDIYSDYQPQVSLLPVGVRDFVPAPYDSLFITNYPLLNGDSLKVPPALRIALNDDFIQDMLSQDSTTFQSADSFRMWFKGWEVRMLTGENTMLAFDLTDSWSRMTIFYHTDTDTTEIQFGFIDGVGSGVHHTRMSNDYTGSVVEQFLNDPSLADSLLFVQGMAGVTAGISFPSLPDLGNILINKAEIEFYAANLEDDDLVLYPRPTQLINGQKNEDGDIIISEDVRVILRQFGFLSPFGGLLTTVDSTASIQKYSMNVTASLQDIQKGKTDNLFYIYPYLKANIPRRVILYGPGHSEYPAKLKMTYTVVK